MKDKLKIAKALALLTQVGISIAVPILLGVWLGNKIDNYLGTAPIFLLIFMLLGIISGFSSSYKLILKSRNGK